jgi:FMN phosphatase YigB (HAD superfamily)
MSIRAVCFDLDDTLLDYDDAAHRGTVTSVCEDLARVHHQVDPKSLLPRFSEINEGR